MKSIIFTLLLALSGPPAFAADITVPTQAPPYTLVRASTTTKGTGYAWFVSGPDGFVDIQPFDNSTGVVFTGPPGRYAIMLVVASTGGKLDQGQSIVVIGTPVPPTPPVPPDPEPDPPIPPSPPTPIPDDEFGVGKLTYDLASKLPPESRKLSPALASLYSEAAAGLSTARFVSVTDAAKWLQAEREKVWASHKPAWDTVYQPLSKVWNDNWPNMDKSKVIIFYKAVAAGLEAVQPGP